MLARVWEINDLETTISSTEEIERANIPMSESHSMEHHEKVEYFKSKE